MKKSLIAIAALLAAAASYGQGTLLFNTKSGTSVDAPVLYQPASGAAVRIDGAAGWGQLYYSAPGAGTYNAVGSPVNFRTGSGAGYITAGQVSIPGVFGGGKVDLQYRAWMAEVGSSSPGAGPGPGYNSSPLANFTLGGPTSNPAEPPTPDPLLLGLQGFTIPTVPEPSFAALGLLGAGLLLIRRKK